MTFERIESWLVLGFWEMDKLFTTFTCDSVTKLKSSVFSTCETCRLNKQHLLPPRILCSEKRDYNSSGLSRYIPKKLREISEEVTSQPLDSPQKEGINASRCDHSVSGSKPNKEEARDDLYMDLQERNDAGSYMNVSLHGSNEGVMSLEKGMTAGRWDHCVPGPKGSNFREAGAGTHSHLQVKNDAGMFKNVSCDDSEEGM